MDRQTLLLSRAAVVAALAAAAVAAGPGAAAAQAPRGPSVARAASAPKPFLDVRDARRRAVARRGDESLRPPSAATERARARLGSATALDVDELTGTPRALVRPEGQLSGPSAGDAVTVADRYVRDHLALLGLSDADLGSLRVQERSSLPGGLTRVRYRQYAEGIPAFDSELSVTVARDGSVLNVLGAPQPALDVGGATPSLSASDALRAVMDDVGARRRVDVTSGPDGVRRSTRFAGGATAALVAFAEGTSTRLGWQVEFRASPQARYVAVVDADTGAVLYRANQVKFVANDASVWEQYPGAPAGGTPHTVNLVQSGWLGPTATELSGPNAVAWSDTTDDDVEVGAGETVGKTAAGDFVYPFQDFSASNTNGACSAATRCSWDKDTVTSWQMNRQQAGVQAFYYVNRFHDHLAAAPVNFTPADGNYQDGDRLRVNTDEGALAPGWQFCTSAACYQDNAYMDTPPDGQSPMMAMFLFLHHNDGFFPDFRDINGADDASIVYHEYTHGLSSRLVTDALGRQALNGDQPGAMGEGWSDFYAKDFLVGQFPGDDTGAPGEVDMGDYTDSIPHSIRSQALDCPVGAAASACPGSTPQQGGGNAGSGGFTYGDFGRIANDGTGLTPEVHADGEIWAETLWDLRAAVTSPVALAIVTQGMRLSPPEPSFLNERDAILQADRVLFGGAHQDAIWDVFAHRGMGVGAADSPVVENFDRPATGRLAASPTSVAAGAPVQFDAAAVRDPRGQSVSYQWDFDGNGTIDRITTSPQTSFAYATGGRFLPAVAVRFPDGGAARSSTTVDVAGGPGPGPTPGPSPSPSPTPTPGPSGKLPPRISLPASGSRARVRFVVACDTGCAGPATMTVSRKVARKLRLGRNRTVGTVRVGLNLAGKKTVTIRLTGRAVTAMRRAGLRRILTQLSVTVTDVDGRRKTARRAVTVRR